ETVQQIDPPAQVKGNLTVITKHCPKCNLRKYAANILVSAAQHSAEHKDKPVAPVPVPVQHPCQQSTGKPPHNTELTKYQAASAHQLPCSQKAEYRLHNISKKRPENKKARKLEKSTSLREPGLFLRFYAFFRSALF